MSVIAILCGCFFCTGIMNTKAGEPPNKIEKSDGGHQIGGTFVTFSYQLIRTSYDPIAERAEYKKYKGYRGYKKHKR